MRIQHTRKQLNTTTKQGANEHMFLRMPHPSRLADIPQNFWNVYVRFFEMYIYIYT